MHTTKPIDSKNKLNRLSIDLSILYLRLTSTCPCDKHPFPVPLCSLEFPHILKTQSNEQGELTTTVVTNERVEFEKQPVEVQDLGKITKHLGESIEYTSY